MHNTVADDMTAALGRGLVAGLAGTAVMTLIQALQMKLTGGESSDTPARAVGKTLHIQPRDPVGRKRLTHAAHWAYGTGWGVMRSALHGVGLRGWSATAAHLGIVWGTALVVLPRLGVAPPVRQWGSKTILADLGHHATYAVAAGLAYDFLAHE